MTRKPLRLLVAPLALLALAGACGGDDDTADGAATTTSTTAAEEDAGATTTTASGGSTTAPAGDAATSTTAAGVGGGGGGGTSGPGVDEAQPGVIELSIVGGDVEGGVRREKVKQGAQVTLRVTSDVADELHVHTYDLTLDLVPGRSGDLTFLARIPGIHEVELEGRHKKVLELEVSA